jgi:hypothetical protein
MAERDGIPESADAENRIPADPPVSEAELTALALRDLPPDDLEAPERNPISQPSGRRLVWLIALAAVALLGALFVNGRKIQSYEINRQRSPDGTADAVLMEVPHDAAGARSYRVCMQPPSATKLTVVNCREIAYLGGVSDDGVSKPVILVWTTSSQLEIRYLNANSVHIYQPVFAWGSGRGKYRAGVNPVIFIKAVQTESTGEKQSPTAQ